MGGHSGISYHMYGKNPIDVLVQKVCPTNMCTDISTPEHNVYYSHSTNSTLGRDIVPLTEDFMKRAENIL